MNHICCNCKWVTSERPKKCHNCNGQTFEETLAEVTPVAEAVPVKKVGIKDRISPGTWYAKDHSVRVHGKGFAIGQAYVAELPQPANKFSPDKEGEANAELWAASKEMLNIIERIIMAQNTAAIYEVKNEAINLLKQLNDE